MKELEQIVANRIKNEPHRRVDQPIHPFSSYAQTVRNLLESGEIGLEDVERVFTDTSFLSPPE